MTGDKQLISGDSWRDSEAAKREKGGLGVQKDTIGTVLRMLQTWCYKNHNADYFFEKASDEKEKYPPFLFSEVHQSSEN
jgi:hypothetical protein